MQSESTRVTKRGAPTIPRTCKRCGTAFLTWRYKLEQGRGNYCSAACFLSRPRERKSDRAEVTLTCRTCATPFTVWRHRADTALYCSQECADAGHLRGEHRVCEVCGGRFYATESRVRRTAARYCSVRCHGVAVQAADHPSRTRDSSAYGDWRAAVVERDGHRCRDCGATGGRMHAHHIADWDDAPELRFEAANGLTLCAACHGKRHTPKGTRVSAQSAGLEQRERPQRA
jgi:ribosomal protein L32